MIYSDKYEAIQLLGLKLENKNMGVNIFYEHLRYIKIFQDAPNKNIPYPEFIELGFFMTQYVKKNGKLQEVILFTTKGIEWLRTNYKELIYKNEVAYWKEFYPNHLYKIGKELEPYI